MEKVQIVRDKKLLRATDLAARRTSHHRSVLALEAQDREGYLKKPQSPIESHLWEAEASWPKE